MCKSAECELNVGCFVDLTSHLRSWRTIRLLDRPRLKLHSFLELDRDMHCYAERTAFHHLDVSILKNFVAIILAQYVERQF